MFIRKIKKEYQHFIKGYILVFEVRLQITSTFGDVNEDDCVPLEDVISCFECWKQTINIGGHRLKKFELWFRCLLKLTCIRSYWDIHFIGVGYVVMMAKILFLLAMDPGLLLNEKEQKTYQYGLCWFGETTYSCRQERIFSMFIREARVYSL